MQGTHTVFQEVQQAISNIFDVFQIHIYYRVAEIIRFFKFVFLKFGFHAYGLLFIIIDTYSIERTIIFLL